MSRNTFHTVKAIYQHHTKSAPCVDIDDEDVWFPLTTVRHDDPLINYDRGDAIEFEAREWILVDKGLDYLVDL